MSYALFQTRQQVGGYLADSVQYFEGGGGSGHLEDISWDDTDGEPRRLCREQFRLFVCISYHDQLSLYRL